MGKEKRRLLFLESFLVKHSTNKRSYTVRELVEACLENGIQASETTVRDDLACLEEFNRPTRELINEGGSSKKGKNNNPARYYIAGYFVKGEVKALIDAVSSTFCLSYPDSAEIIDKLVKFVDEEDRAALLDMTLLEGRIRCDNRKTDIIMETICEARARKVKVAFQYWDYSAEREKVLRHGGMQYKVSPYALVRDNDRSYLIGYCDHKGMIVNFRIDRIVNISVIDEPEIGQQQFNPIDYYNRTFKMYDGDTKETEVSLLVENRFMKNLVDRFGEGFPFSTIDGGHFEAKVMVYPSHTFFAWVFQYCGGVKITGPESVSDRYLDMLKGALSGQDGLCDDC